MSDVMTVKADLTIEEQWELAEELLNYHPQERPVTHAGQKWRVSRCTLDHGIDGVGPVEVDLERFGPMGEMIEKESVDIRELTV